MILNLPTSSTAASLELFIKKADMLYRHNTCSKARVISADCRRHRPVTA